MIVYITLLYCLSRGCYFFFVEALQLRRLTSLFQPQTTTEGKFKPNKKQPLQTT